MRRLLKFLAICLAAAAGSSSTTTAVADGRWQQVGTNADCSVWSAGPRPFETVTWTGACVEGKANGRGVLVWRYLKSESWVEEKYEGEIKDGKKHGRGIFRFSNGNVCNGNWRNNSLRGMGEALRQGRRSRCYEDDNTIKFVD